MNIKKSVLLGLGFVALIGTGCFGMEKSCPKKDILLSGLDEISKFRYDQQEVELDKFYSKHFGLNKEEKQAVKDFVSIDKQSFCHLFTVKFLFKKFCKDLSNYSKYKFYFEAFFSGLCDKIQVIAESDSEKKEIFKKIIEEVEDELIAKIIMFYKDRISFERDLFEDSKIKIQEFLSNKKMLIRFIWCHFEELTTVNMIIFNKNLLPFYQEYIEPKLQRDGLLD